jgi:hypothetical protein
VLRNLVTGALAGLTIFICLGPASLSVKAELNGDNIKDDVSVKPGSETPPGADIVGLSYWYESNTINNRFGDQINISRIDRRPGHGKRRDGDVRLHRVAAWELQREMQRDRLARRPGRRVDEPPQATKIGECGYTKAGVACFDILCRRVCDDVALRLKNDPSAKVVIVGFADPREPKASKLAQSRADFAKVYLGEKGIDPPPSVRERTKASTNKRAEKGNRRVEFVFVPKGASY